MILVLIKNSCFQLVILKEEVTDSYLTINNDGTYNIELGEDDNRKSR